MGENPIAVSNNRNALEKIRMGAGRWTLHRTYFRTTSKIQSWRTGGCRSRTNRNTIERIKKYGPAKFCNRCGNGLMMRLAVGTCLLITSKSENREIYAQANENGAKSNTDHAEPSKNEQAE